jgi:hypothetical protein
MVTKTTEPADAQTSMSIPDAAHIRMVQQVVANFELVIRQLTKTYREQTAAGLEEEAEETRRKLSQMAGELAGVIAANPGCVDETVGVLTATAARPVNLARAMVLSSLVIAATALLSVVLINGGANWFYAEMGFLVVAYLVWQHGL